MFAIKAMENNILAGLITFATAFSAALKLLEEREVWNWNLICEFMFDFRGEFEKEKKTIDYLI